MPIETHLSWSSAAARWAPLQLCTYRLDGKRPSMASAREGTGTDDAQNQTSAFFSHTGPPIFLHTGPPIFSLRDVASARLVHHQLSWESASCCVGVHGRHLSPRCTPSSEVQDIPMRLLTPPVKHLSNFNLPDMSLWNTTAKNTSLSSTALKPPYQQLVPILTI